MSDSTRRSRRFKNEGRDPVTYWIEPWSESYTLMPGEELRIDEWLGADDQDINGEVTYHERAIFVWVERERYEATINGVQVQPGYRAARGFWRSESIRFGDVEFELDATRSGIDAFLHPDDEQVTWMIEACAVDDVDAVPSRYSEAHLHAPTSGPDVHGWATLTGATGADRETGPVLSTDYLAEELFFDCGGEEPVILPDTPATIYVGWHAALNEHRFRFSRASLPGRVVVDWTCNAYERVDAKGVPVSVHGTLALRSVTAWCDEEPLDLERATAMVRRAFPGIRTESAEPTDSGFCFAVAALTPVDTPERAR